MKGLLQRTVTGVLYVALIVFCVLWADWTLSVLCALFAVLAIIEADKLMRGIGNVSGVLMIVDLAFAVMLLLTGSYSSNSWVASIPLLLLYMLVRPVMQLYGHSETPLTDIAKSFFTFVWIVIPLLMIMILSSLTGRYFVLAMFIMIWLNDTGAFIFGTLLGRHRLFERISPKKSIEGFVGGLIVTAVFGWFMPSLFANAISAYPAWYYAAMGVVVSVAATYGDLVESMFKRALHVKDSGNILPGHGGILDRIDSLLLVVPATLLFVSVMTILI